MEKREKKKLKLANNSKTFKKSLKKKIWRAKPLKKINTPYNFFPRLKRFSRSFKRKKKYSNGFINKLQWLPRPAYKRVKGWITLYYDALGVKDKKRMKKRYVFLSQKRYKLRGIKKRIKAKKYRRLSLRRVKKKHNLFNLRSFSYFFRIKPFFLSFTNNKTFIMNRFYFAHLLINELSLPSMFISTPFLALTNLFSLFKANFKVKVIQTERRKKKRKIRKTHFSMQDLSFSLKFFFNIVLINKVFNRYFSTLDQTADLTKLRGGDIFFIRTIFFNYFYFLSFLKRITLRSFLRLKCFGKFKRVLLQFFYIYRKKKLLRKIYKLFNFSVFPLSEKPLYNSHIRYMSYKFISAVGHVDSISKKNTYSSFLVKTIQI